VVKVPVLVVDVAVLVFDEVVVVDVVLVAVTVLVVSFDGKKHTEQPSSTPAGYTRSSNCRARPTCVVYHNSPLLSAALDVACVAWFSSTQTYSDFW
jgi:hypothetical protein